MICLIESHKALQFPVNKAANASIIPVITLIAPSITPLIFPQTWTINISTTGHINCITAHIASIAIDIIPDIKSHTFLVARSEEHTSELQSRGHLVCRLLLDKINE